MNVEEDWHTVNLYNIMFIFFNARHANKTHFMSESTHLAQNHWLVTTKIVLTMHY